VDTNVTFKPIETWPTVTRVHGSYPPVAVSPGDRRHAPPNTVQHVVGYEAETSRTSHAYKHARTRPTVSTAYINRTDDRPTSPVQTDDQFGDGPAPNTVLLDAIFSAVVSPSGSDLPHLFEHLLPLTTIGVTGNANGEAYMQQSGMRRYKTRGDVSLWWAPGEAPLKRQIGEVDEGVWQWRYWKWR
jgi:hypothetical protein